MLMISKKFILRKIQQLLLHSIFWVGVLVFYIVFFGHQSTNFQYVFSFSAFLMPVTIATTYTFNYYIIPTYLLPKRYGLLILYSIYTLVLSTYFIIISIFYGLIFLSELKTAGMAPMSKSILFVMVAVYLIVILFSAFSLIKHNYTATATNQNLQNKILETQLQFKKQELQYLKMQIHPHFLFNTLNTLYGFALKKSEDTPDMILKLANLLDYLLYQSNKPMVTLEEEIDHMQDYIALEKMRFRDTLDISLKLPQGKNTLKIPPMLFIPFVENSFKHGHISDGKLSIHISLQYINKEVCFRVKNSVKSSPVNTKEGIGLQNLKKRLSLLYKDKHQLTISQTNQWYHTELRFTP
ncbi:sensor histidine kinase [Aquimarina hainanensis]|uniref:Sensor histidine kinase n=2 Tax=Aquimarina hainanensis TaxID=1578017 RepID=A0ABW5NFH8_9FLAO|nr:sensor histidine kinase [Aquimarina sp. TRL1]